MLRWGWRGGEDGRSLLCRRKRGWRRGVGDVIDSVLLHVAPSLSCMCCISMHNEGERDKLHGKTVQPTEVT